MFSRLARFTAKYRIPIVVLWIALGILLFIFAPRLSEVGVSTEAGHLPAQTESAQANQILKEKFASVSEEYASSAFIVVFDQGRLSPQDIASARKVHDWLTSPEAPAAVKQVVSVFDREELRPVLVSQDETTMLMNVQFSVDPMSEAGQSAVQDIRSSIRTISNGTAIYLTGDTGLSVDLIDSIEQTVDKTTLVTIILVIVLLLIIYRSPVAILVPLTTIGMSFLVSRGILGFMAAAGIEISALLEAYLVVTIFGVGTDYCLFLVSRFREELTGNRPRAGENAFRRIAPVITASAITVIVAFLCLGISSFTTTRTIGYALAIGVAVTLIAGLTLTPALISLFGRNLFWPLKIGSGTPAKTGLFSWRAVGNRIISRPALLAIPILVVLAIPYTQLPHLSTSADVFKQMPSDTESIQGIQVLREHVPGVTRVDYFSAPGDALDIWADSVHSILSSLPGGLSQLRSLEPLGTELRTLAVDFPGVTQSQNFAGAGRDLSTLNELGGKIATPGDAQSLLPDFGKTLTSLEENLRGLAREFRLEETTPFTDWLRAVYFSRDNQTALIKVIPDTDPYSQENIELTRRLRDAVPAALSSTELSLAKSYVGGEGTRQLDVINTSDADFRRIVLLATLSILLVVILLLRSVLAPLYMVATVLLNFGATLGISTWLFLSALKQENIIYLLPIFVFVILVAVGADYNIFLVSRIKEEAETKPVREAIREAVAHTGGIITACGVILAGTFAALISAPLQLVQVGATIAIGILIDTFLVRAVLVPSLVALAGRWSWWPSRLFRR